MATWNPVLLPTDKFNCWLKFLNLSFLCSGEKPLALYVFSENKEVQRKNTLSSFYKIRCVHKDIGREDDNNDFSDPAHVQDRHQQWGTPYQRHTDAPHVRGCSQHILPDSQNQGLVITNQLLRHAPIKFFCCQKNLPDDGFLNSGWSSCLLEVSATAGWEATMESLALTLSRTKRFFCLCSLHICIC